MLLFQPSFSMAFGEEPLLVRVLSLDQAAGKISGQVLEGIPEGTLKEEATEITIQMNSGSLPNNIHPGNIVRIWGEFSGDSRTFLASDLSPHTTGGKSDPTGVRRRLGKGRGISGGKGSARGHGHQ